MARYWNIVRWFVLGGCVLIILLMLTKPERPAPRVSGELQKQLSTEFATKLEHLADAKMNGATGESESFTAEEVNAGLEDMVANAQNAFGPGSADAADVRIVAVNFVGNEAIGQFIVNRYGKDMYITMSGHLSARDGYANIEVTSAKIGNLSVPAALINPRLQKRLAEPEQHEKLKLPDFIADMRVEDGKLVFVEK